MSHHATRPADDQPLLPLHRVTTRMPDPMESDEGRESEACREVTEYCLSGFWGWVLIIVMALLWAWAMSGGLS